MKKIILDCLGGDNGIDAAVIGAITVLNKHKDWFMILVGDEDAIKPRLRETDIGVRAEIINTKENIPLDEHPTEAIKKRPNSSIVLGLDALKNRDDTVALVSAGSTGALLTGGFLKIGRVEGLARPALCPNLPTKNGEPTMLIDCGANADCKPETLVHFAVMAQEYKKAEGMVLPKIGLLNIGTEETKGSELYQQAYKLLRKIGDAGIINFVGNIESRDALNGDVQILVTDGFTGNILLKNIEGTMSFAFSKIKSVLSSGVAAKIAGALVGGKIRALKESYSEDGAGGSMFIGLNKPVIKAHGNATAKNIAAAIEYAQTVADFDLGEKIKTALKKVEPFLSV
jgi:glycerol-3-phosphate acyltransferase PlsX